MGDYLTAQRKGFEMKRFAVKIEVMYAIPSKMDMHTRYFSSEEKACDFVNQKIRKGIGAKVSYALFENGVLLDGEYPDRKMAEEDAETLRAGKEL